MIVKIGELLIDLIDDRDRMVGHIKSGRGYEYESLKMWTHIIAPGTTVLDVGAYTGLFAIIAAMRGATAIAIEPMPEHAARIEHNAGRNRAAVMVIRAAATDRDGQATLNYNPNVSLTTGASLEAGISHHSAFIDVKCIAIDSLMLKNVGAMKIDVERHEPCVLAGAMQTIRRCRPMLLIETLDDGMRDKVQKLLPEYEAAVTLDYRNSLFTPSTSYPPSSPPR